MPHLRPAHNRSVAPMKPASPRFHRPVIESLDARESPTDVLHALALDLITRALERASYLDLELLSSAAQGPRREPPAAEGPVEPEKGPLSAPLPAPPAERDEWVVLPATSVVASASAGGADDQLFDLFSIDASAGAASQPASMTFEGDVLSQRPQ